MNFIPCDEREGIGVEIAEMTELVRGQDERLLERMMPLVASQSVTLAIHAVERIDAAGITALIKLYRVASESGHSFTVSRASAHIEEILHLVGLERLLAAASTDEMPCRSLRLELTAA